MTTHMTIGRWMGSLAAWVAVIGLAAVASAEDRSRDRLPTRISVWRAEASAAQADYWIGILGIPVDEVLRSQLKIESGLVVQDIVAESPAAEAGVQKHDILLKFNDTPVTDLESLAAAIAANQDAQADLTLIRAGEQRSVKIRPSLRPAEGVAIPALPPGDWAAVMQWLERLRRGEAGQGPMQMWFYPPGIAVPGELSGELERFGGDATGRARWLRTLPQGTSVTVTKTTDGPAQIVVKRGDETWTVDENQLDQLPEELRDGVREMFQSGSVRIIRPGDLPRLPWRDLRPRPPRPRPVPDSETAEDQPSDEADSESWGQRFEGIEKLLREQQQRMREQQERLEQKLDRLRRDWQQQPKPETSSLEVFGRKMHASLKSVTNSEIPISTRPGISWWTRWKGSGVVFGQTVCQRVTPCPKTTPDPVGLIPATPP
jgi:hypothetical protein